MIGDSPQLAIMFLYPSYDGQPYLWNRIKLIWFLTNDIWHIAKQSKARTNLPYKNQWSSNWPTEGRTDRATKCQIPESPLYIYKIYIYISVCVCVYIYMYIYIIINQGDGKRVALACLWPATTTDDKRSMAWFTWRHPESQVPWKMGGGPASHVWLPKANTLQTCSNDWHANGPNDIQDATWSTFNLSGKNGQETSGNHAKWVLFMNIMKESPATSHRSSRHRAHLFPMFFIDLMRRFDGSSTLTRAMGVTSISFRWLTYWQSNGNPISLRFSTEWVQNTHGRTYGTSCKRNQTTTLTGAGIPNQQSLRQCVSVSLMF